MIEVKIDRSIDNGGPLMGWLGNLLCILQEKNIIEHFDNLTDYSTWTSNKVQSNYIYIKMYEDNFENLKKILVDSNEYKYLQKHYKCENPLNFQTRQIKRKFRYLDLD